MISIIFLLLFFSHTGQVDSCSLESLHLETSSIDNEHCSHGEGESREHESSCSMICCHIAFNISFDFKTLYTIDSYDSVLGVTFNHLHKKLFIKEHFRPPIS